MNESLGALNSIRGSLHDWCKWYSLFILDAYCNFFFLSVLVFSVLSVLSIASNHFNSFAFAFAFGKVSPPMEWLREGVGELPERFVQVYCLV